MKILKIFATVVTNPESMWTLGGSEIWTDSMVLIRRKIKDFFNDPEVKEGFVVIYDH